ncbi:MAG: hypothetical protein A4E40_01407 [Methanoregulaceae archaeon PtaU1.Bin059]|nr:MAG: hypothetical protein A4E39_00365 [Methanoregulaceae archaeon PtaB.Bin152]OPY36993.1 MAG: hypothetical protein A4E40_01407 [Methanoregulaceae archaeon PtaU1.Bin059]
MQDFPGAIYPLFIVMFVFIATSPGCISKSSDYDNLAACDLAAKAAAA